MTKLSDLDFYQSPWLTVADLGGKPRRLTVSEWAVKEVQQRDGTKAHKVALSFKGARKRLLCNVTQGKAAAEAWSDDLERWVGKQVILQPGRAENGKETIQLLPVPPAAPEPPPAAQSGWQPAKPGDFRPVQPGALQPLAAGDLRPPEPPAAHPEPGERAPGVWPPMTEAEAAALWATEPA